MSPANELSAMADTTEINPKKRTALDDITEVSQQVVPREEVDMSFSPIHLKAKKRNTSLQAPKFSLDKLKIQNDSQTDQRFSTNDAFKAARESAGFARDVQSMAEDDNLTLEEKIRENNINFRDELLELQMQTDKHAQDSIELRQSINELEYTTKKIKINAQKLKEELYEIDSKTDELQMMIINIKSQNVKRFKLKEKESKLECHALENELNVELYELETKLKKEYDQIMGNHDDKEDLKEIQSLQGALQDKLAEHEALIDESTKMLDDYEKQRAEQYEAQLKEAETVLDKMNTTTEAKRSKLASFNQLIKELETHCEKLNGENAALQDEIQRNTAAMAEGESLFVSKQAVLNDLQQEKFQKIAHFDIKTTELAELRKRHQTEETKLAVEKAKKRRILHQIYDLRGTFRCVVQLYNNNSPIDDQSLDHASILFQGRHYQFNEIYASQRAQDDSELMLDARCLIEDSVTGYPVSIISVGNSVPDTSARVFTSVRYLREKLDKLNKEYTLEYQYIDIRRNVDLVTGKPISIEVDKTGVVMNTPRQEFRYDGVRFQDGVPSLFKITVLMSSESFSMNVVTPAMSIQDFSSELNVVRNQASNAGAASLLQVIYQTTKTLTIFDIDTTHPDAAKWLQAGNTLNQLKAALIIKG